MNYQETMRILRGSQRYKGALDKDITIPYTFEQTHRMLIETERNAVLNLNEQYFIEREESTNYRIYGKVKPIIDNIISGETSDPLMLGFQTYYYPPFPVSTDTTATGYPSINFFEFFVPTALTTSHNYVETNSYKDNWLIYTSYVYKQMNKVMIYTTDKTTGSGVEFDSSDGIPFQVLLVDIKGKEALQFICPVEHGILEGEYIELQSNSTISAILVGQITTVNGSIQLPVYSFGNEFVGTEKKIFNVLLRPDGTIPNAFTDGDVGVFKRLSDPANYNETLSKYYIHAHKIVTDIDESIVDRAAFEFGVYNKRFRFYRNDNSPPYGIGHEVVKNQSGSYLWNFSEDLDVKDLRDNLNRPLKDLYVSIFVANQSSIWQGREVDASSVITNGYGIGWDWNFIADGNGIDEYPTNYFTILDTPNTIPSSGDTFLGAFVEYNEFELKERIISESYHALKFNPGIFTTDVNGEGYYYQPHYRIPIRKDANNISSYVDYRFVPSYATFSIYEQLWRWRTILEIGFYDSDTNGLDYPFVNGSHYPFKDINFFIKPIVLDKPFITDGIISPSDDDCE